LQLASWRRSQSKPFFTGGDSIRDVSSRHWVRIDRNFPYQVAILIPVGGLVARLTAMHEFCDTRSMLYKTRSDLRRESISGYIRFCFRDPGHADAFMAEFGGERITIEPST
jgi:hypothetical protein